MWQGTAGLWEASAGIIGVLVVLIGFGIAAQFSLVKTHQRNKRGEGNSASESTVNPPKALTFVSGVDASSNRSVIDLGQKEIGDHTLELANKGQ
jgi:hypothetical protein